MDWPAGYPEPQPIFKLSTKCPIASGDGVLLSQVQKTPMFDTLFDELNDMPGEIFDVIDYKEEWEEKENKFDVEDYINSNIDY